MQVLNDFREDVEISMRNWLLTSKHLSMNGSYNLCRAGGGNSDAYWMPLKRVSAHDFVVALDNHLFSVAGFGLHKFHDDSVDTLPEGCSPYLVNELCYPDHHPMLTVNCDQGYDNVAGLNFLVFGKHYFINSQFDLFHGYWNDMKNAMQESGHWPLVSLSGILINLPVGLYSGAAFYGEISGASKRYTSNTDDQDVPFSYHYPFLLQDDGRKDEVDDPKTHAGDWLRFESGKYSFLRKKSAHASLGRRLS